MVTGTEIPYFLQNVIIKNTPEIWAEVTKRRRIAKVEAIEKHG